MAFTFSSEALTRPLAQFGQDSAQMILQTGAVIQQGLQQMMTSRQVQAMGTELGQLNPASPEWAQQAVQLGSRYPLAMKSPAGQFMLSTQAKAHAEWSQAQQGVATLNRQIELENLRTNNDIRLEGIKHRNRLEVSGNDMIDLREGLPEGAEAEAVPAPVVGSRIGSRMPQLDEDAVAQPDAPVPTPGMSGLVPNTGSRSSPSARVRQSLIDEGIVKIPQKEFRREVAAERRADNSRAMQEDRQRQQEALLAERTAIAEKKAAESATVKKQSDVVKTRLTLVRSRINDFRKDLAAFIKDNEDKEKMDAEKLEEKGVTKADLDAYFRQKAEMQAALQKLGEEENSLMQQFEEENSLMQQFEEDVAAPVATAARPVLKYDPKSRSFK